MPDRPANNIVLQLEALLEITDDLMSLILRNIGFENDLRYIIESISQGESHRSASTLIRRVEMNIRRGNVAFSESVARVGINRDWLWGLGRSVIRRAKQAAQASSSLLPATLVYLARDVGEWTDDDRANYSSVLHASALELDRFVVGTFGGAFTVDGNSLNAEFISLESFKDLVAKRMLSLTTKDDFEVRRTYRKSQRSFR